MGHIDKKSLIPNNIDLKINGFDFKTDGYNYSKTQMYFLPTEIYYEIDFPDISISFIKYTFLIFAYIDI